MSEAEVIARVRLASEPPLRLGSLTITPALRLVTHDDGRQEILEPRVMQVLVALVRAGGGIVTRDDLLAACWAGVVVGEDAIGRTIGRLRRLGETLGAFRLETVTRVGYRLLTEAGSGRTEAPEAPRRVAICVLPFANMSDDPQQRYFSDGITEDVITDLSKVSSLYVTARTTSFAIAREGLEVPAIARRLDVTHVLEGSIRKVRRTVRITVQLIDGATGGHVWAERYDRDLTDIFAVQDEISEAVVRALRLKLAPDEAAAIHTRETNSPQAYDLYLMARRYYVSGEQGDRWLLEAIVRLCRRAVELDPLYARAWVMLGLAQTALELDYGDGSDAGEVAVARALGLDPDLADAHALYARHLWAKGREIDALAEIDIALTLEPGSWAANSVAGQLNYRMRRFEDAIRHLETATAVQETANSDPGMLMSSYSAIGDDAGALRAARITLERAERALARETANPTAICCGVSALAAIGESDRARDMMERGLLIDPENMKMRYNFGCGAVTYLKDPDTALELLRPVFAKMSASWVKHARNDPDLDKLRHDPRFRIMMAAAEARVGMKADRAA